MKRIPVRGARINEWAEALDLSIKETRAAFEAEQIPNAGRGRAGRGGKEQGQWSAPLTEESLREAKLKIFGPAPPCPLWLNELTDLLSDGIALDEIERLMPPDEFFDCFELTLEEAITRAEAELCRRRRAKLPVAMRRAIQPLLAHRKVVVSVQEKVEAYIAAMAFRAAETGHELTAGEVRHMRRLFSESLSQPDLKTARRAFRGAQPLVKALWPHPRTLLWVVAKTKNGTEKTAVNVMKVTAARMLALQKLLVTERGYRGRRRYKIAHKRKKFGAEWKWLIRALPRRVETFTREYWHMLQLPRIRKGFNGAPTTFRASFVANSKHELVSPQRACRTLDRAASRQMKVPLKEWPPESDPLCFGWPMATARERRPSFYRLFNKKMMESCNARAQEFLDWPRSERRANETDTGDRETTSQIWADTVASMQIGVDTDPPYFDDDERPVRVVMPPPDPQ